MGIATTEELTMTNTTSKPLAIYNNLTLAQELDIKGKGKGYRSWFKRLQTMKEFTHEGFCYERDLISGEWKKYKA